MPRHGSLCINLDETYLMSLNSASAPLRMDSFVDGVSIERRSFVDAMSLFVMSFFVIATTINAPWFFNRLRRYISSVLTYLLTCLLKHRQRNLCCAFVLYWLQLSCSVRRIFFRTTLCVGAVPTAGVCHTFVSKRLKNQTYSRPDSHIILVFEFIWRYKILSGGVRKIRSFQPISRYILDKSSQVKSSQVAFNMTSVRRTSSREVYTVHNIHIIGG